MNHLIANLDRAKIARRVLNGRTYYVAPASILVPGVLNGSKGRLYYPPDEVQARPGVWNGYPLTVNHPMDPITGSNLSARDPGVLDRQGIGFIQNDRWEGGRRRVNAWFDVEATRAKEPRILQNLEAGRPIEISTGLYTHNITKAGNDPKTGRPFDFIAVNYRPDHLAVLVDQVGACSIADGCGVFNRRGPCDDDGL